MTSRAAVRSAVARRPLACADPGAVLEALRGGGCAWLLESALRPHPLARFSFAGADPWAVVRGHVGAAGLRAEVRCLRPARPDVAPGAWSVPGDPLEAARRLLPPAPADPPWAEDPDALPFVGGAVGYLGYELAAAFEPAVAPPPRPSDLPDLVLLLVDRLIAVDHAAGRTWAVGLGMGRDPAEAQARAEDAADSIANLVRSGNEPKASEVKFCAGTPPPVLDVEDYTAAVGAILERIGAGDVYQACLTRGLEVPFDGDPWDLYRALRRSNPAPFAAFLELPEVALASSSPERFLRVDAEGTVESRPIKGTRPRGADAARDAALAAALAASAKDRAENLMIVDLVRNDLGRVCRTGSVAVPELFRIESYASVHQMVSVVRGRLAPGRHALDALRAAFPPGSMTGAPKIAAMRLLAGLEPGPRGPYAGALGYLDVRGGADLSVVIRTLQVVPGRARLHTGGGVVADSDPRAEHAEALDKAAALLEALAACGARTSAARPARPAPGPATVAPGGRGFTVPSAGSLDGGEDRPIPWGS